MQKINAPLDKIDKYAGLWIVIGPVKDRIIAVGETLRDIAPLVVHSVKDKNVKPPGIAPYFYLVPRKDEGPYIL